jgi:hypothetical protein
VLFAAAAGSAGLVGAASCDGNLSNRDTQHIRASAAARQAASGAASAGLPDPMPKVASNLSGLPAVTLC